MSETILTSTTAIANQWWPLAAAWHVVVAAGAAILWWRGGNARVVAALLSLMPFSVATMAAWSGNPFNTAMFVALGLVMLALSGTTVPAARLQLTAGPKAAAGAVMCVFGWSYPHFLGDAGWHYAYAAPLGLLPCPTLAFLTGVSLLTNAQGSPTWATAIGVTTLIYGLIGVFFLGVAIDWVLVAGAVLVLAGAAARQSLRGTVSADREMRHI